MVQNDVINNFIICTLLYLWLGLTQSWLKLKHQTEDSWHIDWVSDWDCHVENEYSIFTSCSVTVYFSIPRPHREIRKRDIWRPVWYFNGTKTMKNGTSPSKTGWVATLSGDCFAGWCQCLEFLSTHCWTVTQTIFTEKIGFCFHFFSLFFCFLFCQ